MSASDTPQADSAARTSLGELAALFARLGATAFGGPAAHIAMMHDEVVSRRGWLSDQRFLDLLSAANLIPGPNSTELALHIGWERRRLSGLVVAGVSFIVPAMLITGALGWVYVHFGNLPAARSLLYGVKPVILAVVAQAIVGLAHSALRTRRFRVLAALVALGAALGTNELLLLFAAGTGAAFLARLRDGARSRSSGLHQAVPIFPLAVGAAGVSTASPSGLFWVFLKVGSVLFGSGYVLLAFLRADLVERLHWLSESQLVDAIAVGQITPGPVFTTATFIGYVLAGPWGALAATSGIFLPAFVLVGLSGPLVPRLRAAPLAGAFLDGVNVASLALMAVVTLELARSALLDAPTVLLAALALFVMLRFKPNASWLVLAGAGIGWLVQCGGLAGWH